MILNIATTIQHPNPLSNPYVKLDPTPNASPTMVQALPKPLTLEAFLQLPETKPANEYKRQSDRAIR
jgi:hypothetical protein